MPRIRLAPPPKAEPAPKRRSPLRALAGLLPVLLPAAVAAAILCGVLYLGRTARDDLREDDRFRVRFADTDCAAPPGLTRGEFLGEVQYLSGWADTFVVLGDPTAPGRLRDAFARHPWVAEVERVTLTHGRAARVEMRFRAPALAVGHGGRLRAVDADGVLLPAAAPTEGLPRFEGTAAPPQGPAGSAWGDAAVTAAARAAARPR